MSANPSFSERWFEYQVHVYPHDTDYAGVVWHGSYINWMEAARIEYLRSLSMNYRELVALGCELPVVDLSIRYHRSIPMGEDILVKTCLNPIKGVRLNWDYQIQSADRNILYVTAQVTLVAVDREKGKIMRRLPTVFKEAITQPSS